ncbi:uroporphyrinogen decarboxylase family protein [Facklamia sp. DSM 111018]|uniref:Uroporphyrinogen decarboxylase family protein n=1 Tax=Facklamia lactis TaxID=2749967 RepID=A0ABS0LRG6_9LACT|nr:uroporphyrinogen decarboxylase family protein [Facklamia lactis]MBG9986040.1 uroporphyrinogen decarboxylase family protein [Facklamia lactis]
MLSFNRIDSYMNGQKVERKPVVLFENIFAAKLMGLSYAESEKTAELISQKIINCYKQYDVDDVSLSFGTKGITVPLGAKLNTHSKLPESLRTYPLKEVHEIEYIDLANIRPSKNPRLQKLLDAYSLINQHFNQLISVRICIGAPFSLASNLIGPEKFLRLLRTEPKASQGLLSFASKAIKLVIDEWSVFANVHFHFSDPFASGDLISPRTYEQFALPYTEEVVKYLKEKKKNSSLHICGNTSRILSLMADTGIDCLSLDQKVDLEQAKKEVGHRLILLGNVDPVAVLQNGNKKEIYQAVKACFESAGESPKGFIIAPGCDLTYDTPAENIQYFVEVAKKFALNI